MKTNKSILVYGLFMLVLFAFLVVGCGGNDAAVEVPGEEEEVEEPEGTVDGEVITLDAISYWSAHIKDNIPYHYFIDRVNEELGDRIQINMLGGPEVVAVPDQAEAVYTGMVDLVFFPADFYMPYVPEIDALKLSEVSPLEMHENGAHEFFDELFHEKGNAKFLGQLNVGPEWFGIYLRDPIESVDDLNGLIFRTIPAYEPFLESLGVETTRLSWEELVTAMERGTVDGFGHSISGGFDIGVHEASNYLIEPFFYYGAASMVMNLDSWNSLPADLQAELAEIAYDAQVYGFEWAAEEWEISLAGMIDEGLEIITLPPADAEIFLQAAEDAGWADIEARSPENVDRVRELLTK